MRLFVPNLRSPFHVRASAVLVAILAVASTGCDDGGEPRVAKDGKAAFSDSRILMGTRFAIRVVATDETLARSAIAAALDEVARLEERLSEWRESSEISELNRRAGEGPVRVGPELLEVVQRAAALSEITEGAFDITFAACGNLWSFERSHLPERAEVENCLVDVDYRLLRIDVARSTLELPRAGMRIGIAGIGKGYGVDAAAQVLERFGIHDFFVDGGGDIRLAGTMVDRPWTVGIADPRRPGEILGTLEVSDAAIVTSGDYQNYFERDGVRYHHILDPNTGQPARGAIAVTVIAPTATDADALATGLFVLGLDRGIELAERLAGVEAVIVADGEKLRATDGFPAWR